ncbi:hypothetical protein Cni_G17756 [Canna indica]|uniref:Uncharacterized protein n=1 Tax=Canna indica TaxID=4628 RepID=A0AAQ3KHM5_9LILI|nr:hypothetical protein Cni_G17756 [Canna indica]
MASGLVLTSIPPTVARASAFDVRSGGRRAAPIRAAGRNNWWTPLFGWSAEPDYIDGVAADRSAEETGGVDEKSRRSAEPRRFAAFTEEKARELRMRTMESEAFHDIMYHSAIASRLASDLPRRPTTTDI